MEFKNLIEQRQSCRSFQGGAIPQQDLDTILEAIRLAPSARNSQPYRVFVVTNQPELNEVVAACQYLGGNPFLSNCSAMLVFVLEKKSLVDKAAEMLMCDMRPIDAGIAIAHAVLQAKEMGIDSCIIGWINEKKMKKALGLDKNDELSMAIGLGYATKDYPLREKKRKSAEKLFVTKIDEGE